MEHRCNPVKLSFVNLAKFIREPWLSNTKIASILRKTTAHIEVLLLKMGAITYLRMYDRLSSLLNPHPRHHHAKVELYRCDRLQELLLSQCHFLAPLANNEPWQCTSLTRLSLASCWQLTTDAAHSILSVLKELKHLELAGCRALTSLDTTSKWSCQLRIGIMAGYHFSHYRHTITFPAGPL